MLKWDCLTINSIKKYLKEFVKANSPLKPITETSNQNILKMIKQPENSKLCGQCCLGTILNISLEEAIKLIGHKHGTRTKEIIKHFRTKGNKLTILSIPTYALCKVHYRHSKLTHWIIYNNGHIYDPIIGECVRYVEWQRFHLERDPARITSSIEIMYPIAKQIRSR